jgi:hypothetical protein
MKGHGTKFSRKMEAAEAALLTGEPYEDPPQKSLFDVHNRPRTLAGSCAGGRTPRL